MSLNDTGQRYANSTFCREDGSGRNYVIPRGTPAAPKHLCIPTEFFTTGWHLVLTLNELTTFLAVCHVADLRLQHDRSTVMFLAEWFRYSMLGLTDEAYVSIHELAEFGLIEVTDPMPNRKRGRIQAGQKGEKPLSPMRFRCRCSAVCRPPMPCSTCQSSMIRPSTVRSPPWLCRHPDSGSA